MKEYNGLIGEIKKDMADGVKAVKKTTDIKSFFKNIDNCTAVGVGGLFAVLAVINALHPAKPMSEKENRDLAMFPEVTLASVADGSFMKEFETYTADQFVWRDGAVSLKADSERLLGKKGNNGINFAKNSYLIQRPGGFNKEVVDNNINALKTLQSVGGYNMTVAAIPTAFEILQDKLPQFAYDGRITDIEKEITAQFADGSAAVCDTTELLKSHNNEYLYYRTDHHQTALGSYYVYQALGEYLGYEAYPLNWYEQEMLSNEFYGTSWSKASLTFARPDAVYMFNLRDYDHQVTTSFPLENGEMQGMYNMDNLAKKDKYTVYLDGNHGLTVLNTNANTGRKLAVLKDSYAHSVAPFLSYHYDSISLIDMRYYNDDLVKYLGENGITDVLVLYNAENFNEDTNLVKAGELAETTDYFALPPYGYLNEQPPVDDSYFEDAVFFGDSLTDGHSYYCRYPAKFVFKSGSNTYTVDTMTMESGKTVMQELLDTQGVNKYFIMFGINEISYTPMETFIGRYRDIINRIRAVNPNAIIYIESILPVQRKVGPNEGVYIWMIQDANAALEQLAVEMGCWYIDIYNQICDSEGYLPEGSAADGTHFGRDEHVMWDNYLQTHCVNVNCGGASQTKKFNLYTGGGSVDIEGYANAMLSEIGFVDTMNAVSDNVAARSFDLDENAALAGAVYMGGGSTAEEFAIFETASPEAAQELAEKARAQVDGRKPDFETYKPEQMAKLNEPVIEVHGNVVMVCVSDNNEKAKEIMSRY